MGHTDPSSLLRERIQLQEIECAMQSVLLKDQFKLMVESLKPMNLIKDTFTSIVKNNVVDTAIGLTSGYIAKKAIVRASKNPFLKLLGAMIGMGVANLVTKHPEGIKSIGGNILNSFFKKEKESTEKQDDH